MNEYNKIFSYTRTVQVMRCNSPQQTFYSFRFAFRAAHAMRHLHRDDEVGRGVEKMWQSLAAATCPPADP